jgi:hypothetical protein
MHPFPNKWTAFWFSLLLPGAGQLCARSWLGLPWLVTAGLLGFATSFLSGPLYGLLALCSAEHAKRLREPSSTARSKRSKWQVSCNRAGRAIRARITGVLPMTAAALWRRAADLPRFLTIDPFHVHVVLMRPRPAAGVDVLLLHNAFGWRFARFGRILRWREGQEYAFSDFSPRDQAGFPHVFFISVEPLPDKPQFSRLTIDVRGKWTSRLIPPWLGRIWVWYVSREHARLLRKGL